MSMHPDDRQKFADTFSGANLMKRYNEGARVVQLITRQIGDDGIYRKVETSDYFVKNPASEDVLVICLCDLINE
jgi:hypothetical protein